MKLWLLQRGECGYVEFDAFVIRAETEEEARRIAMASAATEGAKAWHGCSCERVIENGDKGIVLASFNAG